MRRSPGWWAGALLLCAGIGAMAAGAAAAAPAGGDDRIAGTISPQTIAAGAGDDVVAAGAGNDRVLGGAGRDRISGGSGQDVLSGGAGADRIAGGRDADLLAGGAGDDVVLAAADGFPDGVTCGPGDDVVVADTSDRVGEDCESVTHRPARAAHLLWADTNRAGLGIARASTDGGDVTRGFITTTPRHVLADVAVGWPFLFTTDFAGGRIIRTDWEGADRDGALVSTPGPSGATASAGWVYWTEGGLYRIGRARWNGKEAAPTFIGGLEGMPRDVTTDGTHLYWTSDQPWISRAAIDGSRVEERFIRITGPGRLPYAATGIDTYAGHLYWATVGLHPSPLSPAAIGHARTDGSDVRQVVVTPGANHVGGVAVDGRHIFWSQILENRIGRADLDGTDPDPRFLTRGVAFPQLTSVERVPAGALSPWARDLGSVPVGAGPTAPAAFSVTNSGNAALGIGAVSLAGVDPEDFRIVEDGCSGSMLAPDGGCTVSVTFSPTGAGGRSATVEVPTDGLDRPLLRSRVAGNATAPDAAISPPEADFGARAVGSGPGDPVAITVTSTGTAPLTLGQAAVEGEDASDFPIRGDTCSGATVAPGGSCQVAVRFDATEAGPRAATLAIPATGIGTPALSALLEGTGLTAAAAIVPRLVRFPEQRVGSRPSAPRVLTVESVGTAPLHVTAVEIAGTNPRDFAIAEDGCSGRRIAAGDRCTVGVTFSATADGGRGAQVRVRSDDPGLGDPAAAASLAGEGSAPPPPAPPLQPVPAPAVLPEVVIEGCGPVGLAGVAAGDAPARSVNGVRQPVVTRPYGGAMTVTGTATCASGLTVSLWGPELRRRSGALVGGAVDGGVQRLTSARIQTDGSFALPADARAPGQYFVTLGDALPLTGSPVWLRVVPRVSASRRGADRVVAFAGPPAATAGARVGLERRVAGRWREVAHATVSRRARAELVVPDGRGPLRVVLGPARRLHSQGDLMTGARAPVR